VIRDFLHRQPLTFAASRLPVGGPAPPFRRTAEAPPGGVLRRITSELAALLRAVPLTVVTSATQIEKLRARQAATDDEPK